jgi:4-hydroxy-tetrahydrodipicolinate reductase
MKPIKVAVQGAMGRVGQEVVKAVSHEPDMQLVGAIDIKVPGAFITLPDGSGTVPCSTSVEDILTKYQPDVIVDFSSASATMTAVRVAAPRKVAMVIGTTGMTRENLEEIGRLATANGVGVVAAPNFALGAVLMMHLAKIAAKYFDYAEIIELHHHLKADAPSGTALLTARQMVAARGKPFTRPPEKEAFAARGQSLEGITIHSVRLPGMMAHQEVLFGTAGQTLSIRHDTINRECYMPGVLRAVREVVKRQGLTYGLDALLGL